MPLWLAVVLLLLALGGIVLCRRYLRHDRSAQALCIVVCALTALACAVYIGPVSYTHLTLPTIYSV